MRHADEFEEIKTNETSYAYAIREVLASSKDLLRAEITLAKEEAKTVAGRVARHSAQAALFGALLVMSFLPFLAFLVIGLGDLLGNRYWLSSLIVAVLAAGIGGFMAYRAFRKIADEDLGMPATRRTLEREADVISGEFDKVRNLTKRRAV